MTKRNDLLTTMEAAAYVRLSHRTLERYRVTGEGPTFVKLGRRVFYPRAELDKWIRNGFRRSTSDPGPERTEQRTRSDTRPKGKSQRSRSHARSKKTD